MNEFTNDLSSKAPYINICSINYRLKILNNKMNNWLLFNLNDLFLNNNRIELFENTTNLKKCFDSVIYQEKLNIASISLSKIKKILLEEKYILGLYDTYYMCNHPNYQKIHNYNSLIIHGFCGDKILVHFSSGTSEFLTQYIDFNYFIKYVLQNLNEHVSLHPAELTELGFPLSILSVKNKYPVISYDVIYEDVFHFYIPSISNQNITIFKHLYDNCCEMFYSLHYYGKDYDLIANFKIIQDFFMQQNEKLILFNLSEAVENNRKIIKYMQQMINKYARYIYTLDACYILQLKNILNQIIILLENNYTIIKNGNL